MAIPVYFYKKITLTAHIADTIIRKVNILILHKLLFLLDFKKMIIYICKLDNYVLQLLIGAYDTRRFC